MNTSKNTTNSIEAEVMIVALMNRYEAAIETQNNDTLRAEYKATGAKIIATLKKMNSTAIARKYAKTFGYAGCFNVFNVDADERQSMIEELYGRMMSQIYGDWTPAISAKVMLSTLKDMFAAPVKTGRFDDNTIRNIRCERLANGTSYRKIGAKYGVSGDMIRSICIGESYSNVAVELIEN